MALKLVFDLYRNITQSGLFHSKFLVDRERTGLQETELVKYTLTGLRAHLKLRRQSQLVLAWE